ncbi:hypothetical protein AB1Y20_002095 [Prymnesium parvum]|uniref:Uncharacterized protein n=1 Tax=Prymnesium parvum TaxID=97485 RepID=A0AB34J8G2_PRYPA
MLAAATGGSVTYAAEPACQHSTSPSTVTAQTWWKPHAIDRTRAWQSGSTSDGVATTASSAACGQPPCDAAGGAKTPAPLRRGATGGARATSSHESAEDGDGRQGATRRLGDVTTWQGLATR